MAERVDDHRGRFGDWPAEPGWFKSAAGLLYGGGAWLGGAWQAARAVDARIPVISLGNLEVGGTGKTPATEAIARLLLERGLRPGLLTGLAGQARGMSLLEAGSPEFAGSAPDEARLLARRLPGLPLVAARRKWRGALRLAGLGDCDLILLDDGFQHRRLRRSVDLVLLSGAAPLENSRLLPAGPLREFPRALGRADALLLPEGAAARAWPDRPRFRFRIRETGLGQIEAGGGLSAPGAEAEADGDGYLAVSGIARPQRFESSSATRYKVLLNIRFRDHAPWSPSIRQALGEAQARFPGARFLLTEKDAVRWGAQWDLGGKRPHFSAIEMEWLERTELGDWLAGRLGLGG